MYVQKLWFCFGGFSQVRVSRNIGVWGVFQKRLRFWKRSKSSDLEMQVLESFMVPKDTISITGSEDVSLSDDKVGLGMVSVFFLKTLKPM